MPAVQLTLVIEVRTEAFDWYAEDRPQALQQFESADLFSPWPSCFEFHHLKFGIPHCFAECCHVLYYIYLILFISYISFG